mmetsp:Transcript_119837/g.231136  ORF Transcript_119837/g.231136 Transcript_119837/m.231136 type:complete len:214 (+) Transcript_119837:229-870(+)
MRARQEGQQGSHLGSTCWSCRRCCHWRHRRGHCGNVQGQSGACTCSATGGSSSDLRQSSSPPTSTQNRSDHHRGCGGQQQQCRLVSKQLFGFLAQRRELRQQQQRRLSQPQQPHQWHRQRLAVPRGSPPPLPLLHGIGRCHVRQEEEEVPQGEEGRSSRSSASRRGRTLAAGYLRCSRSYCGDSHHASSVCDSRPCCGDSDYASHLHHGSTSG